MACFSSSAMMSPSTPSIAPSSHHLPGHAAYHFGVTHAGRHGKHFCLTDRGPVKTDPTGCGRRVSAKSCVEHDVIPSYPDVGSVGETPFLCADAVYVCSIHASKVSNPELVTRTKELSMTP